MRTTLCAALGLLGASAIAAIPRLHPGLKAQGVPCTE